MWVPTKLADLLGINLEHLKTLQSDLAVVRAERDLLKVSLASTQTTSDWLRMKVNQLEFQNAALLEKAYNIKVPVPVVQRKVTLDPEIDPQNFNFDDIGEELAKEHGLPSHTLKV